jgi:hypothetical protein
MARKLNPEEHETFNQLLEQARLSGHPEGEVFSTTLSEKAKANLKLSPESAFWFGDDISGLPLP